VKRRYAATLQDRKQDAAADGLYHRVWIHLCRKGLIDRSEQRRALEDEVCRIRTNAERRGRQTRFP
jgi:hypothetical protein